MSNKDVAAEAVSDTKRDLIFTFGFNDILLLLHTYM